MKIAIDRSKAKEQQVSFTFSSASSVFSGLAFRAWEASMMGMGMKRMVKFLKDQKKSPKINQSHENRLTYETMFF